MATEAAGPRTRKIWVRRHPLLVRLTHWVNLLCVAVLLPSGLQIFNAHPALYWGEASRFDAPFLALGAERQGAEARGYAAIGPWKIDTTGVLGLSADASGQIRARGFPAWATVPSWQDLATGRRWHFFFAWLFLANLVVYLAFATLSGHLRRELAPDGPQLRALPRTLLDHLRLRLPRGAAAQSYNPLQRVTYLAMVLIVLPLLVMTGLGMSPGLNAVFPWLTDIFGGRQSARSVHFLAALALTLFVLAHVLMLLLAGAVNSLRSMITGRYRITWEERAP